MEQNSDISASIAPVAENNKQNGGNGLKIATVIVGIVAVCGIGFGIYGMIEANSAKNIIATKDTEISNLTDQLDSLNAEMDELKSKANTQQDGSDQGAQADEKQGDTMVYDGNLTPGVENGVFVFRNSAGTIVMQDNEIKNVSYIISCDGNTTGKCTAKTSDGKSVWFVFDLNNKEIKSGYSTVDYGL